MLRLPSALLLLGLLNAQAQEGKPELDLKSLEPGILKLQTAAKKAIQDGTGNLDTQNVHWVFAFSTGHYKSDPLGAQAAREVATQLVQNLGVTGDRVTARAWEMQIWEHKPTTDLTRTLQGNTAEERTALQNLWPTTPQQESVGGHDTEQAIVSLTQEFQNDAGTLIFLVTNTAASIGAAGQKVLGLNAPDYLTALENWNRVDSTRDGATVTINYIVKTPERNITGSLDVILVAPRTFVGPALPEGKNREVLRQEKASEPVKPAESKPFPVALLLVPLLLGIAYLLYRTFAGGGSRGGWVLEVEGQRFDLAGIPVQKVVVALAGTGVSSEDGTHVVNVPQAPAEKFAEIIRVPNGIKIRSTSENFELKEIDGKVATRDLVLPFKPDLPDHSAVFAGEVRSSSGIPRHIERTLQIRLVKE
ncbi:hypothetical protein GCM10008938_10260 [Deinococcus roseus]|uniref:VWFA domain-containing protein n=1 Tax=Deinococcus roseus TaxID=392414 RepID=A0ABQ2CZV5_9DEIO|nr:hypothetical protein GCM10008938_10260 [Deinococcus roseus]